MLTSASDINDSGWIVGNAYNSKTNETRAFILSPVPEPETYAMLMAGLGLMGWLVRRKKMVQSGLVLSV